jgi:hypothetical protein
VITVNGRAVISRADISAKKGYSRKTLATWWEHRDENGHPPVVHQIQNTYFWDAEAWNAWDHQRLHPPLNEAESTAQQLCELAGISRATFDRLRAERATNGQPDPVRVAGRAHTRYWHTQTWIDWYQTKIKPGPADPQDDDQPDEEIGPAEFARIIGHQHTKWVSQAAASDSPPPGFPVPDHWETLPSGRQRPKWRRRRAVAYDATRRHRTTPEESP